MPTLGIALALFGVAGALLTFPLSPKLTVLAAFVGTMASAWLMVLAFRTVRAARARERVAVLERTIDFERAQAVARAQALERAMADERGEVLERARRLTESSFLAGSNALINVRGILRSLQDCRGRLEGGNRSEPAAPGAPPGAPPAGGRVPGGAAEAVGADDRGDPAALSVARALESLQGDLARLTGHARQLRPLAGPPTHLTDPATSEGTGSMPGEGSTSEHLPPVKLLTLDNLKLQGIAAELEHGLLELRAGVRGLERAGLTRPSLNGRPASGRSPGDISRAPDVAWGRALERLEGQVDELAEHVAGFTRITEQLSRELGQLR